MGIPIRVLLAEDSENDALLLVRELKRAGYDPLYRRVDTAPAMTEALRAETWDLVMGDYNMPHFSGPAALALVQEHGLDLPFIFVSGTIGEDVAVAAMKAGAHDYVMKGNLKRLVPAIERELRDAEVRRERRRAREALLERARLSELSSDIGAAITQGASIPEILQRSADAIIRHLDAAQADIWIYGEGDRTVTRAAVAGLPAVITPSAAEATQLRFASNDLTHDERFAPHREWIGREQLTAFAGFPLVVQNRLVGLLAVFNRAPLAEVVLKALGATADTIAVGIERKQSDESLRATQARLQQLLAASAAVIYASRVERGSVTPTWVSENIAPILGHPPADALSASWWAEHVHPDDRARVLDELAALHRKPQVTVEYRFRRPDGSYRWLRDESRRLIVAPGAP
ncbi:MAG TPA: PAS domain-containing protein, partial [Gemmatimonadales bacterium]|nr:PAS domain-containing protein [Gemmatimonadales bacterium]